jgi:hypothetical protein
MSEYRSQHRAAIGTLGHFMELAPQTSSTDQEQFIVGNVRPWNAENAFLAPAIRTGVDQLYCIGESGFDEAQCSLLFLWQISK